MKQEHINTILETFNGELVNFDSMGGRLHKLDKVISVCGVYGQWVVVECRTGMHAIVFNENYAVLEVIDGILNSLQKSRSRTMKLKKASRTRLINKLYQLHHDGQGKSRIAKHIEQEIFQREMFGNRGRIKNT